MGHKYCKNHPPRFPPPARLLQFYSVVFIFIMVSAGIVASCLALLAPARGFVSPIVTRTPGAEVRAFHVTGRVGRFCV